MKKYLFLNIKGYGENEFIRDAGYCWWHLTLGVLRSAQEDDARV